MRTFSFNKPRANQNAGHRLNSCDFDGKGMKIQCSPIQNETLGHPTWSALGFQGHSNLQAWVHILASEEAKHYCAYKE